MTKISSNVLASLIVMDDLSEDRNFCSCDEPASTRESATEHVLDMEVVPKLKRVKLLLFLARMMEKVTMRENVIICNHVQKQKRRSQRRRRSIKSSFYSSTTEGPVESGAPGGGKDGSWSTKAFVD